MVSYADIVHVNLRPSWQTWTSAPYAPSYMILATLNNLLYSPTFHWILKNEYFCSEGDFFWLKDRLMRGYNKKFKFNIINICRTTKTSTLTWGKEDTQENISFIYIFKVYQVTLVYRQTLWSSASKISIACVTCLANNKSWNAKNK